MKTNPLLLIVFALLLAACGNTVKNSQEPGIMGTWEIIKAEGLMAETNLGTRYIFKEDGTLTLASTGFINQAKTVITDSTFTWNNGNMEMEYNYHFKENNLVVNPKGSDQHFILEKK